jgi:hypothetical protein
LYGGFVLATAKTTICGHGVRRFTEPSYMLFEGRDKEIIVVRIAAVQL